jgi:hypothetical protein
MGLQLPAMSPAPHLAESGKEQYCFSGQRTPAIPPHNLPVATGDEPEPAGAGEVEGAGGEEEGAVGGKGPELTTPVGVSTGTGGVLEVGAALATAVVLGAGASAGGVDCAEQLTIALSDRRTMHSCSRFGLLMRSELAIRAARVERADR